MTGIPLVGSSPRLSVPTLGSNGLPTCPWQIQDEVELYARESGRTAKVHFIPMGGWFARFSLRVNDPAMERYQQGAVAAPPTEDVWFHVADGRGGYTPLDIVLMGPSGVRRFLEKGNLWSGRGEHSSLEQVVRQARQEDEAARRKNHEDTREANRADMREQRRFRLGIPVVPVGVDLNGEI